MVVVVVVDWSWIVLEGATALAEPPLVGAPAVGSTMVEGAGEPVLLVSTAGSKPLLLLATLAVRTSSLRPSPVSMTVI
jgi:hypothetical protein